MGREVARAARQSASPCAITIPWQSATAYGSCQPVATAGVIEQIVARAGGAFTRRDPNAGAGNLPLTTIAGLDQLIVVFAAREPAPHLRLLDRLLVLAESQSIIALICLNKVDQQPKDWLIERWRSIARWAIPSVMTSAATGAGISELRGRLARSTLRRSSGRQAWENQAC